MCDQKAHVEELAAKTNRGHQAGRETAEQVREEALYAIQVYKAGGGSEEEEAAKAVVIAIQASEETKAAEAAFTAAVAELSANHRATTAEVDVLHLTLEQSDDRTRRIRQMAPIKRAIIEVQVRAANQRDGTAEPEEDLYNDIVTSGWMPKLFNGIRHDRE
jgi:hypothetical protein